MAKKIYMTSFKGGTGVTTCCVGLGLALSSLGERTLIVDGDSASANALQTGGCPNLQVYTLADYAKGACRAKQTLISHPKAPNLSFSSSLSLTDKKAAERAVSELDGLFDYILLDKIALKTCDSAIIVTEPFLPSVKSADCCKAYLADGGIKDIGLIVNKINGGLIINGDIMTAQEIATLLHLPLTAVIPEDLALPLGKNKKITDRAFKAAAEMLTGRREAVCNVLRPYFGLNGFIKRKVREML
ncbi:MAG: AAA family ATPase [Clostridia bacterium]|nr:AAA family ATPase [Clostridia bacterium]